MKDEFFERILNVVESRPFITTIDDDEGKFRTIAQISEGKDGQLWVTLQSNLRSQMELEDTEVTMTLPAASRFGISALIKRTTAIRSERKVPLYPAQAPPFSYANEESERVIDGRSISLADPVGAKTLTLWYEGIRAEGWDTNSDKQAVTIHLGEFSTTKIPPHGTSEFFIAVAKPESGKHPIEWVISDIDQGVIVRTDRDVPVIKISIAPAEDRDITWGDYIARIEVQHGEFEIEDVTLHIWRTDEAEMDLTEIEALEEATSHALSFMNSAWCRPKVAIGWRETWSDSKWWGTWTPVWGAWRATVPARRNRHKNWMPIETEAEKVLQQVLRNIRKDHHPVIERYLHNTIALDRGDWISSVTASVAILQRLATNSGFRTGRRGRELWDGIAQYLRSKGIEKPYYFVAWGEEGKRLIEEGQPHDNLLKAITELRNNITGHWLKDEAPENASWLAQQALYYVESAMRAELVPAVPQWDRTGILHHPPKLDDPEETGA